MNTKSMEQAIKKLNEHFSFTDPDAWVLMMNASVRLSRLEAENTRLKKRTRTLLTLAKMWRKAAWKWYHHWMGKSITEEDSE